MLKWQAFYIILLVCTSIHCSQPVATKFGQATEGSACYLVSDCLAGLTCHNKTCVATAKTNSINFLGQSCAQDSDCGDLVCGRQGLCSNHSLQLAGGSCSLLEDCIAPLVCNSTNQCADVGSPGTLDLGSSCVQQTDCQKPYVCGLTQICDKLPYANGLNCQRTITQPGDYRVYFEVPSLDPNANLNIEFYRLPFPNNIRKRAGKLDLSGHYAPNDSLGVNIGTTYLTSIEADTNSFSNNQPIFFSLAEKFDLRTICLDSNSLYPAISSADLLGGANNLEPIAFCEPQTLPSVYLVDIDKTSANYGQHIPVELAYSFTAGQYICQNWLGLIPLPGQPLNANTTYAAIITTAVQSIVGDIPFSDADFATMLANLPPNNATRPELNQAYVAMAPLRAYLQAQQIDPNTLAAATVFTTGTPEAIAPKVLSTVAAQSSPTWDTTSLTLCDQNVLSPCDDGFANNRNPNTNIHQHLRGCFAAANSFFEIQGRYGPNPVMQIGQRPYRRLSDGGAMQLDNQGMPVVQGTENMCFALSIPKNQPMPLTGWPTVIYAHGTGGSFRTFVVDGTAQRLSSQGFAVLSFDGVIHGFRQGNDPNTWSNDTLLPQLFFNIANPRAARDNVMQGIADLFTITRLVHTTSLFTPSTGDIRFDNNQLFLMGHSQGALIAPAFLSNQNNIKAAILAGAGSDLVLSILYKTQPLNFKQIASAFLGDHSIQRVHPMMGLIALFFGPADSLNYNHALATTPYHKNGSLAIFQVMGIGDTYTPDITQQALATTANLPIIGNVLEAYSNMQISNSNWPSFGAAQYQSDSTYDPHYVMYYNPQAQAAVLHFLYSALVANAQIVQ